jgi:hypothetical protein
LHLLSWWFQDFVFNVWWIEYSIFWSSFPYIEFDLSSLAFLYLDTCNFLQVWKVFWYWFFILAFYHFVFSLLPLGLQWSIHVFFQWYCTAFFIFFSYNYVFSINVFQIHIFFFSTWSILLFLHFSSNFYFQSLSFFSVNYFKLN